MKSPLALICPLEILPLLQQLEKRSTLFRGLRDEMIEGYVIPIRCWTSFGFLAGFRFCSAMIWFEFTSIPQFVTKYPRNFPELALKAHLVAFNFRRCCRRVSNVLRDPRYAVLLVYFSPPYYLYRLPYSSQIAPPTF